MIVVVAITLPLQYYGIDFIGVFTTRIKGSLHHIFYGRELSELAAQTSLSERLATTIAGIRIWEDYPFFGVGLNNYQFYGPKYKGGYEGSTPLNKLQVVWVQVLVEGGILLFFSFALLWGVALLKLKKYMFAISRNPNLQIIAVSMYYILWGDVINMLFNYSWIMPQRWFNLAIACNICYHARNQLSINR